MPEFINGQEQVINTSQDIYDAFNNLIFSDDLKVLGKFVSKIQLYNMVRDIPGDIVECGVFKGSGILSWLKIKEILHPNAFKKVIGFDYFDTASLIKSLKGDDQYKMAKLFSTRNFEHGLDFEELLTNKIFNCGFDRSEFELVKGDITKTASDFVEARPGFKISLLYMDLDLEEPTYYALASLWHQVSRGGIVVFDEYAYHQWSESIGVDRFFQDLNITVKSLDFNAPTAYVIKP